MGPVRFSAMILVWCTRGQRVNPLRIITYLRSANSAGPRILAESRSQGRPGTAREGQVTTAVYDDGQPIRDSRVPAEPRLPDARKWT